MNTLAVLLVVAAVAVPSALAQANRNDPIKGLTGLFAKFTPVAATVPKITDSKCSSMKSKNVWTPFTLDFKDPPQAQVKATSCDASNRCVDYFEVTAQLTPVQVAQTGPKTIWYGFEGSIPGPTINVCKGRQSIVKIGNNLTEGVGMSTHLHGAATLSPWDGWAEDVTDYGKAKYYRYPNSRAATLWYHDHDIHHTAHNAYFGLAAIYFVRDCCDDEQFESLLPAGAYEHALIVGDRTIDPANNNQLYFEDPTVAVNRYGDIIFVNGVPWPVMKVEPRTYRFRVLNIGITRTYTFSLDSKSTDVPLYLVGTDGGLLQSPVRIMEWTHEVASRYEVVIDFTGLAAGREVVLVNNPMPDFGQDEFCWTHLVMKFVVLPKAAKQTNTPISSSMYLHVDNKTPLAPFITPTSVIDAAQKRANQDSFDKHFLFHRSNGEWQVNGRTWDDPSGHVETFIKENDIELWKIENGGGGWIHPIHIHLVDFFVVRRTKVGLLPFDPYGPKDVVLIRPGETVYAVARYGAHNGQWMFHCHNLMHEDNDMMRAFEVHPQNVLASFVPDSPLPSNNISANPMGDRAVKFADLAPINLKAELAKSWYDVFFPPKQPKSGYVSSTNVWEVQYNKKCVHDSIIAPLAAGVKASAPLAAEEDLSSSAASSGAVAGVAVGAVVGSVAVVVVIVVIAVVIYRRRVNNIPNMSWDDEAAVPAAAAPEKQL